MTDIKAKKFEPIEEHVRIFKLVIDFLGNQHSLYELISVNTLTLQDSLMKCVAAISADIEHIHTTVEGALKELTIH